MARLENRISFDIDNFLINILLSNIEQNVYLNEFYRLNEKKPTGRMPHQQNRILINFYR